MLIARKDPSLYPRVAARRFARFLEEHPHATIEDAGLAASSLIALPGSGYREAAQTLKAWPKRQPGKAGERDESGGSERGRLGATGGGNTRSPTRYERVIARRMPVAENGL